MMNEQEKQALELAREDQRLVNAYRLTFRSESGKVVLEDLLRRFSRRHPLFMPTKDGHADPCQAAMMDGQRQVMLYVEDRISTPFKGDGDVEKPQTTVITE